MSREHSDSAEVMEFLRLFSQIKSWSDDIPEDLPNLAMREEGIKDLCISVGFATSTLKIREKKERLLFAAPANPEFIEKWRDYERRYQKPVDAVIAWHFLPELGPAAVSENSTPNEIWMRLNEDAIDSAKDLEVAIDWAYTEIEIDSEFVSSESIEQTRRGLRAWEKLKGEHGLDIVGVLRRRALIPFILVPREVSARHGSAETISMLKVLQQAQEAFVFGANFASVALMRTILEATLRDHYGAEGRDLSDRITHARDRLPPAASMAALHRLRKAANSILHLNLNNEVDNSMLDNIKSENEIVSYFYVLRTLIEGARK